MYYTRDNEYNIILIVADALRMDCLERLLRLGLLNTIKEFYENGYVFEKAYSLANMTDPSITTILTGLHPLNHGVINHGNNITPIETNKAMRNPSLPMMLARWNYLTFAVDFLERWHRRGFYYYASIHETRIRKLQPLIRLIYTVREGHFSILLQYLKHVLGSDIVIPGLWQDNMFVLDIALRYIREALKRKQRFFLFLHLWSTHIPYYAPLGIFRVLPKDIFKFHCDVDEDFKSVLSKIKGIWGRYLSMWADAVGLKSISDAIRWYYASIIYLDQALQKLINFLRSEDANNTLIVFTSDHGESLCEHGIYFDHHGLYEVSLRVPLIFYALDKSLESRRDHKTIATHMDIVPTLLSLLNIKNEFKFNGVNLFSNPSIIGSDRSVVAIETYTEKKIAMIWRDFKFIKSLSIKDALCRYCGTLHGDTIELYNLREDPKELINLAETRRDIVQYFSKLLNPYIIRFKILDIKYNLFKHN